MGKKYLQIVYCIWSRIYDDWIDKIFRFNRKKVVEQLCIKKGDCILEIGVGTGLNLPYYPKGCKVWGIDFSKMMISRARKKKALAKVVLKEMDAQKMVLPANYFDRVLATYALRVAPDPNKIMKEASGVAKPGALFVVLDQFKEEDRMMRALVKPVKLALGWGKEYGIKELARNTPWKIKKNIRFGRMKGTRICVFENTKKT